MEDYQKAIAEYDQAIKLNPQNADFYNDRGQTYYDLKKYRKAIADYNRAIELDPKEAEYYDNRGDAFSALVVYSRHTEVTKLRTVLRVHVLGSQTVSMLNIN